MALVDRFLTEIRQTLESNGTWESTLVIFSSDHGKPEAALGHRTDRVPFLVKLPGQRENRTIREPVNTVITRALISAVVEGRIQTADDLEFWVGTHRQSLALP
jgi:membrane-anchored protein YejM (alkaline phosphatase superfamily)